MKTIELTGLQATNFKQAGPKLKAMAKAKAFKLNESVALTRRGRTLYIAHPNGKGSCGGCGQCRRCLASQARAEARAVD